VRPAPGQWSARIIVVTLMGLFCGLDQLSKNWIEARLALGQSIPVIPEVFQITHVKNTGAAFSMLEQYPSLLLAISTLLFLGFLGVSLLKARLSGLEAAAYGLILGGALGNLSDRLSQGHVTDYLDFVLIRYPIFNLADVFIFCGVVLLIMRFLKSSS
jgi:signal peptidase II